MRTRSNRMRRVYVQRRRLVARILQDHPICQRCRMAASVDVHELKSRARGGSILDESNCAALCRPCHEFVTTHPAQAEAEGFLLPSWATPATDPTNGATR